LLGVFFFFFFFLLFFFPFFFLFFLLFFLLFFFWLLYIAPVVLLVSLLLDRSGTLPQKKKILLYTHGIRYSHNCERDIRHPGLRKKDKKEVSGGERTRAEEHKNETPTEAVNLEVREERGRNGQEE